MERVHAPLLFVRSPTRTLSPFARTWGRTLTHHRLPFTPPLWCAHPSVCLPPPPGLRAAPLAHSPPLHACGGALLPVTSSLSHPRFGVPTLPFARRPRLGCAPPRSHTPPLCTHAHAQSPPPRLPHGHPPSLCTLPHPHTLPLCTHVGGAG